MARRPCRPPGSTTPEAPGKPLILLVASGEDDLRALVEAVRRRFGADYAVSGAPTGRAALARVDGDVAVVVAGQRLDDMSGVDLLGRVKDRAPGAKRGLLIRYRAPDTNQVLIEAATFGRMDAWEWQPWEPLEERLYPFVGGLLAAWSRERQDLERFAAVEIVAVEPSARTHELRDLLDRNGIPNRVHPPDSDAGGELLASAQRDASRLPVAVFSTGVVLVDPTNAEVATALGVTTRPEAAPCDLAVVGAGPAGLAAAVYAASEGLDTVMVEAEARGGQAGTSSLIRNYLGFPGGISGEDLARRASEQAILFGAKFVYAGVADLRPGAGRHALVLDGGGAIEARAVLLATGVHYRRLEAPGVEALLGAGVYYGAATTEAPALRGESVFVAAAANSAGQAALHLSRYASEVTILVRGPSLGAKMSDYLVRDIERAPNIAVRTSTEVAAAAGAGRLERLTLRRNSDEEVVDAAGLFVLVGAAPKTDWLPAAIERDAAGYVLTGPDVRDSARATARLPHEASVPGVFAAGDVRHGSVKRVASAAGEGAVTVAEVHRHLALTRARRSA